MYPPIKTGTSFYSKNVENALRKKGHEVKVITLKNNEVINSENGSNIIRLPAININFKSFFKHFRISSFFISNYKRSLKTVMEFDPDHILLINHYLDIAFIAVYVSKKLKIPLYVSIGTQLQSLNFIKNHILNFLDRLICGKMIFPFVSKIISWDKEILRYLNDVHNYRFNSIQTIIPFGVNGDETLYCRVNHSYILKNQILGVGSVIGHRNYIFHVIVFKELLKKFPDLKLKIIGHVYDERAVKLSQKYGIGEMVDFMGEQPHSVVLEEMKKSDIHWMMLDGNYTGLGTSNLEAMLLGVPVVSNIPENLFGDGSLTDMNNFIHCNRNNTDEIVKKFCMVLQSSEKRKAIGIGGMKFVKENMNWNLIAENLESVFNG